LGDDLNEEVDPDYGKWCCQKLVSDRHHHRLPKANPRNANKAFNARRKERSRSAQLTEVDDQADCRRCQEGVQACDNHTVAINIRSNHHSSPIILLPKAWNFFLNPLTLQENPAFYENGELSPIGVSWKFGHLRKMHHIFRSVNMAYPRSSTRPDFG
jgi:hypothetical protein